MSNNYGYEDCFNSRVEYTNMRVPNVNSICINTTSGLTHHTNMDMSNLMDALDNINNETVDCSVGGTYETDTNNHHLISNFTLTHYVSVSDPLRNPSYRASLPVNHNLSDDFIPHSYFVEIVSPPVLEPVQPSDSDYVPSLTTFSMPTTRERNAYHYETITCADPSLYDGLIEALPALRALDKLCLDIPYNSYLDAQRLGVNYQPVDLNGIPYLQLFVQLQSDYDKQTYHHTYIRLHPDTIPHDMMNLFPVITYPGFLKSLEDFSIHSDKEAALNEISNQLRIATALYNAPETSKVKSLMLNHLLTIHGVDAATKFFTQQHSYWSWNIFLHIIHETMREMNHLPFMQNPAEVEAMNKLQSTLYDMDAIINKIFNDAIDIPVAQFSDEENQNLYDMWYQILPVVDTLRYILYQLAFENRNF